MTPSEKRPFASWVDDEQFRLGDRQIMDAVGAAALRAIWPSAVEDINTAHAQAVSRLLAAERESMRKVSKASDEAFKEAIQSQRQDARAQALEEAVKVVEGHTLFLQDKRDIVGKIRALSKGGGE